MKSFIITILHVLCAATAWGQGNAPYGTTLTMPDEDVTVSVNANILAVVDWSGTGSEDDPYIIENASQLDLLANRVNGTNGETANDYNGTYFKLGNDITYSHKADNADDAATDRNYVAIGYFDLANKIDRYFCGDFDGDGHTISGIRIYKSGTGNADCSQGLFGQIGAGAVVHGVTLADARITGHSYTGGIVGYNKGGTVRDCRVVADVTVSAAQSDAEDHGGIVGFNKGGTVSGCTSAATLVGVSDRSNYGAIAGSNVSDGNLTGNLAIGAIVPQATNYGAIVGYNEGTLQHNYYVACKVANTENATGVGCGDGILAADVTAADGAVPYTVTFAPEGYATFYDSRVDLVLPAGTNAYVVTAKASADGALGYEKIADGDDERANVVPANTAVLLQTTPAGEATQVQPALRLPQTGAYDGTNLLHGSIYDVTADEMADITAVPTGSKFYKLTYGTDTADPIGWYYGVKDGAPFPSGHNKAWLALPAGATSPARFLALPGNEASGIAAATVGGGFAADTAAPFYTLDGRRVNAKPGVYVQRGKKVVIR